MTAKAIPTPAQVAGLDAGRALRFRQGRLEVKGLGAVALLAGVEGAEQPLDLVVAEAGDGHVDVRGRLEVREQPREQVFVPVAADAVERQVQEPGLFFREVEEHHRHRLEPEAARGDEPLVAADHAVVLAAGEDRVDEAELLDAAGERLQLGVADAAGIRGVVLQVADSDLLDPQLRCPLPWQLGDHKILCGDATDAADVAQLLANTQAAMAFTDPPYNVAYGDHGGQQRGQRKRRIANDAMTPEAWEAFCRAWAANLVAHVNGALYVCMSTKEWPTVSRILAEAGAHWSDTIIWAKDRFVLGRADYQRQYEPLWYGWPEGGAHHWCGDRDQGDVWTIPRPAVSDLHPTAKPLALVERAIENSSEPGDTVLDLFLGSGTTLIACERTGRVCLGMEVDPHYCSVAIARWEAFAGEKAVRA